LLTSSNDILTSYADSSNIDINMALDKNKKSIKNKNNKNNSSLINITLILTITVVSCLILIVYRYKDHEIFKTNIKSNVIKTEKDVIMKDSISCKDNGPKVDCINWKQTGHCEKSPAYMVQYCASTCEMCNLVNPEVRCKKFYSNPRVFKDNEMDQMFNNLVQSYTKSCTIDGQTDETCAISNSNQTSTLTVISRDPWIITIDDFISAEEADIIISIPPQSAWIQSTAAGAYQADGLIKREVSETRTSRNAWCQAGCDDHKTVQTVLKRMSQTVNVPISNFEHMQILKYDKGQFYRGHHDFIHSPPSIEEAIGPRILTFFLYLSDVTSGGETHFNTLNISVTPSKGKALIWANTMANNPNMKDERTFHEAKDVIEGIKYSANIWIHQKDFRSASHWACSG